MDTAKFTNYLQRLPLFKGVPETIIAKLANQLKIRNLTKGEVLVHQGDASDSLFIIYTGWVKITTAGSKGEEVVLNQCGPGQIVGEQALIDQDLRSATVAALSPATVLEFKRDILMEALNQHPALGLAFIRNLSERLRFANTYIERAIEWSQHITQGDYDFVLEQVEVSQATIVGLNQSYEARANAFLATFFKMAEGVRKREEALKQQVQQLTIQIDEVKRQKAVDEITDNTFFGNLQATAMKLRQERQAKKQDPDKPGQDD